MAGRIVVLDQLTLLEKRAVQIVGIAGRRTGRAAAEGHVLTLIFKIDDEDMLDGTLWRSSSDNPVVVIGMGAERQRQCGERSCSECRAPDAAAFQHPTDRHSSTPIFLLMRQIAPGRAIT